MAPRIATRSIAAAVTGRKLSGERSEVIMGRCGDYDLECPSVNFILQKNIDFIKQPVIS
ncbi:MAG: hypothetical protein JWL81_993 [Verrucomicrobiales bacterium]|nr:hypothetical protein [Verrucomicrobiales bacterium]